MPKRTLREWRNAVDFRVGDLYEHLTDCVTCASIIEGDFCTERQAKRAELEDALDRMQTAPKY